MEEPKRIPLTDSPRAKNVKTIPLKSDHQHDTDNFEYKTFWKTYTINEDNPENNPTSISELDSLQGN